MAGSRKNALGRGFEDLFSNTEIVEKEVNIKPEHEGSGKDIVYIDINEIKPNRTQPRKFFDAEKIKELAESIKKYGVIQPIMLRPEALGYEIVAGERRWRAAREAGLKVVPALVRDLDEEQNMFIALIENIQREDLNPIEEARAYDEMSQKYRMTQEEISNSMGKSRPYIANMLRLLKLNEKVQDLVLQGMISQGHGKILAGIQNKDKQLKLANETVSKNLTVRQLEKLAADKEKLCSEKNRSAKKSREILNVEEELKTLLGTKVEIKSDGKKGTIEIEFYSREELERLYEIMKEAADV